MKKNIFVEDDKSKNCVDYPHDKHETYNDCDEEFLASSIPAGLVPIWLTNNKEKVTTRLYVRNLSFLPYLNLLAGHTKSPCPMPCSTIHVESRYLFNKANYDPSITLHFGQSLMVTRTDFVEFHFLVFLSDIGGSMGLWLGLGLLQAVEISIRLIMNRIRK